IDDEEKEYREPETPPAPEPAIFPPKQVHELSAVLRTSGTCRGDNQSLRAQVRRKHLPAVHAERLDDPLPRSRLYHEDHAAAAACSAHLRRTPTTFGCHSNKFVDERRGDLFVIAAT